MKRVYQIFATTIVLFVCISMIFAPLRVDATYPVIDYTAIAKLISQMNVLKQQYEALKKNLAHLNPMNALAFLKSKIHLLDSLTKLGNLRDSVKGLTFNYSKVEEVWNKTYKNTDQLSGMKDSEYASHLKTLDEQTSNALLDAMKAQSLITDIDKDKEVLEDLMNQSSSAAGMLEAMQVGNQINSLQVNQLVRMQTIMAMSYRAQTMYYQWEMQEKMSQRIYAQKNQIKFNNPLTSSTSNSAFPQF